MANKKISEFGQGVIVGGELVRGVRGGNDTGLVLGNAAGSDTGKFVGDDTGGIVFTLGSDAANDLYFRDTGDNLERIAVGDTGQVLTVSATTKLPAWAAGGGLVFITSTDLSSDATAEFTGFDATNFDSYLFVLQNVIPETDATALYLRTSTNGGSSYDGGAGTYEWVRSYLLHNAHANNTGSTSTTQIAVASNIGSDTNEDGVSGRVYIHGPHLAKYTRVESVLAYPDASASLTLSHAAGSRLSAADVDACQFLFNSGGLESGTITMYGLKNA